MYNNMHMYMLHVHVGVSSQVRPLCALTVRDKNLARPEEHRTPKSEGSERSEARCPVLRCSCPATAEPA